MTWLDVVLSVLFVASSGLAIVAQRRFLALRRKHRILQRLYDQAEQQLTTLWTSKKP